MQKKFTDLSSADHLDRLVAASTKSPQIIFKHSNQCSLSASAFRSLSGLGSDDPEVHILTVQEARSLSNEIEDRFEIRHESPQIIIFSDGEPIFNSSHRRATFETVREFMSGIETQKPSA